ncbi:MAG: hypothetical protein HY078_03900 [Elusimicrobia bacterium]|nr:hypothetical protein [Elusimicrobiota bacterium]
MKLLAGHVVRDHVLLGAVVAGLLYPWLGVHGAALFWFASVMIDVDHYLHFLSYTGFRDWTPQGMFRFHGHLFGHIHREDFIAVEVFHTFEFLLAAGLIATYAAPLLLPAYWGCLFHLVVDVFHLRSHRALDKRAHSFVSFWWRRRKLQERGLSPDWIYHPSRATDDLRYH